MAEVLADCGAHVTLADVDAERLESVTAGLGGAARSFVADVSDEAQVRALVDDVVAAEGGLDVVFANAGIASVPGSGSRAARPSTRSSRPTGTACSGST